ncbi:MAG: CO dehydrogenase/acetyl-CoA synthase subunit delta [Candidatus Omnitrophota bacterium]
MERVIEKWQGKINEVIIGATKENGGTRSRAVKIGGENSLPFLHFEGECPNKPVIAMDVWDMEPPAWPDVLKKAIGEEIKDPVSWAKKCQDTFGADLICLRLASAHPENKNTSPDECAKTVKAVLAAVSLPLIIIGSGNLEKDNELFLKASEAAGGERALLGIATKDNYKTVAAACMAFGHGIIAEAPIDVNLGKQLNILISDTGFPGDKIIQHQATGALGYGFEYTYSIMERIRLAALTGDKLLQGPMINMIAQEVYRTKEAKAPETEMPQWGELEKRAPLWEAITAVGFLQSGSDILVMAHPQAVSMVHKVIDELMQKC